MNIRDLIRTNGCLVMGILNATPDSFSGDGLIRGADWISTAMFQIEKMISAGADIIDIGGESTRPGSEFIDDKTEIARVLPLINALRSKFDIPISIDTYKATVAKIALQNGANIINDVTGFTGDEEMINVAKAHDCPVVLMHNSSKRSAFIKTEKIGGQYLTYSQSDRIEDIRDQLLVLACSAISEGIDRDNIILDPGIGFGKSQAQNLEIISKLSLFCDLGFPILIGPSRKSFIGNILNCETTDRDNGTAATVAVGVFNGASIVRIHNVEMMTKVVKVAKKIKEGSGECE